MSTFWVMAVVTIFDTIQGLSQGVIRALALQKQASYIALAAYYIVTIPLACILVFVAKMNVAGLWAGIGAGCFLQAFFYIYLCWYISDWDQIADEAYKRVQAEGLQSIDNSFISFGSIDKKLVTSTEKQTGNDEESEFVSSFKQSYYDD